MKKNLVNGIAVFKPAILMLFFLVFYSCNPEDSLAPSPPIAISSGSLTIDEAKVLYEKYLNQNKSLRTSGRKHKEKPSWDMSEYITLADSTKALVTTLIEDKDALTLVSFDENPSDTKPFEELFTSVKLVAYKDLSGNDHLERMYIKGDLSYSRRKKFRYQDSDFSGRIWFEDMHNSFLRALFYENGKLVRMQDVNFEKSRRARKSDYVCDYTYETVTTSTSYYSITCSGSGDCGPPRFMYNSNSVTTQQVYFQSCREFNYVHPQAGGTNIAINDIGFWDWFNRINSLERNWILANPDKAYTAYQNFVKGEVSSQGRYGGLTLKDEDGTNQNAYKHALSAALHNQKWGTNIAYEIMNNHEGGPPPGLGDIRSQMDYWNNKLGIDTQNDCGCEGDALRALIQFKIDNGYGRRVVGTNLPSTILSPTTSANLDND